MSLCILCSKLVDTSKPDISSDALSQPTQTNETCTCLNPIYVYGGRLFILMDGEERRILLDVDKNKY